MTPEGRVKKDCKKLLDSYGEELYYLMPVQSGYGRRAVDFIICFRGIFIALEIKRLGEKGMKFQMRILNQVACAGGETLCIDNVEELRGLLTYLHGQKIELVAKDRCGSGM